MAQSLLGKIEIQLGESYYTLRPSLEAICKIEWHTALPALKLIAMLRGIGLPPSTLQLIAITGMDAAGYDRTHDRLFTDDALNRAAPRLLDFLLQGIGYMGNAETLDDVALKSLAQPDWRDMFITYVGIMGRPVREFWSMTMDEYALAVEGFCLINKIDPASTAIPATSQDLAEMIRRFPDERVEAVCTT